MKKLLLLILVAVAMIAAPMSAIAAPTPTLQYTDSLSMLITNWDRDLTIQKFDPSYGTLLSIDFALTGNVQGTAKYESLDNAPATITLQLSSMVQLQRPDNTLLVLALPVANVVEGASAFDGLNDFLGTSGSIFTDLSNTAIVSYSSSSASDLALFTGTGNILLGVAASGASNGSGAGNLITQFNTDASASATVTYNYAETPPPVVPEPISSALFIIGAATMGFRRFRKK